MWLTAVVAFLLVAGVHAVGVGVAAPADGDAVTAPALELVAVAPHHTVVLGTPGDQFHKFTFGIK